MTTVRKVRQQPSTGNVPPGTHLQKHGNLWTIVAGIIAAVSLCIGIGALYARYEPVPDKLAELSRRLDSIEKRDAQYATGAEWTGQWTGAWDNTYFVELNIVCSTGGKCMVVERHIEHPDQPEQFSFSFRVGMLDGETMHIGHDIVLHRTAPNAIEALGAFFSGNARHATLTRSESVEVSGK